MKFVHLSPGAGDNFFRENCLRDAALVPALRRIGGSPVRPARGGSLSICIWH